MPGAGGTIDLSVQKEHYRTFDGVAEIIPFDRLP